MPDDAKTARRREALAQARDRAVISASLLDQHGFARWLQGMFALSLEITQFTQGRLQEDIAAWSALAICRSPEEAMDRQRRFAGKATEQYAEEIGKLSQMMVSMTAESLTPPRQRPHAGT
jgi:phasin family protein